MSKESECIFGEPLPAPGATENCQLATDNCSLYWSRFMDCLALAYRVHLGQTDKAGDPYICHVGRVGFSLLPDWDAACLGLLHDVLEDTASSDFNALGREAMTAAGADGVFLDALMRLTRTTQTYEVYIDDIARHPLARKVKIADLRDNLQPSRILRATDNGHSMARMLVRYHRALAFLEATR